MVAVYEVSASMIVYYGMNAPDKIILYIDQPIERDDVKVGLT